MRFLRIFRPQGRNNQSARWIETVWRDVVFALRMFRKNAVFTAGVGITLAFGIGLTTAVFSIVNGVLLRPLPFKDSDRLVWIWSMNDQGLLKQRASYPDFLDWRAESQSIDSFAGWNEYSPILTGLPQPEKVRGELFMGELFTLLGVNPILGTAEEAQKDQPGEPGVILSHHLWERAFNSDASALGKQIRLDGLAHTITAVMPPGFQFPLQPSNPVDLWVKVQRFNPALAGRRDARLIEVIARLKPNVTHAQAQAEMSGIAANLRAQYPQTNGAIGIRITPAKDEVTGEASLTLLALFAAAIGVLAIACVNIANLQLVRALQRRRELAVRASIGAGRRRLSQQLAVESLLLGIGGGTAGCVLALAALQTLKAMLPPEIPRLNEVGVDLAMLAFGVSVSVAAGLIFGLAPVWFAARSNLNVALSGYSSFANQRSRRTLPNLLATSEIALALILLAGAGLFVKSLWRLNYGNPGYDAHNVLTFGVSLPSQYRRPHAAFEEIQERLRAIPGVSNASAGLQLPDRGRPTANDVSPFFEIEGRPASTGGRPRATVLTIQPGYFHTAGIPLLKGRDFSRTDGERSHRVVIINESMAQTYFPGEDPIGKRIKLDSWVLPGQPQPEIIGVAGDVKYQGVARAQPLIYAAMLQFPRWGTYFVVKTEGDPLQWTNVIRNAIESFDPDQPIHDLQTFEQRIASSLARERFNAFLLTTLSIFACALAAIGLYAVLAYMVGQRRREMSIRIALGADRRLVLQLVLHEGLKLAVVGVAIGTASALALTRFIRNLLFVVSTTDPLTFVAVPFVLLLTALAASWIPARSATKADPMTTLRAE
jgi:predicted permease